MSVLLDETELPEFALDAVLASVPQPILVLDDFGRICFANMAAEDFFGLSTAILLRKKITDLVPFDSPVMSPIQQAQSRGFSVHEYDIEFKSPRSGLRNIDVVAGPIAGENGLIYLTFIERGMADQMTRQLTHQGAARSVRGIAAVLAHEIKNPLLGIRGAAQLLEQGLNDDDKTLAVLIRDECDRIRNLVDRLEGFSDNRPIELKPVNIHAVLEHVKKVAESSFAQHIQIQEQYDPSLPEIAGDRDQLVQAFLNLVRNAVEAVSPGSGAILLRTAYRPGFHLSLPGMPGRQTLPLEVSVIDNGSGISPDLMPHLFDPFVTTKPKGTGLGLALVAKIVGDHGGVIDCESEPRRTTFRTLLPIQSPALRPTG